MFDKGWKVHNAMIMPIPWYINVLLMFRKMQNHFDPALNRGVVFKTLFKTLYVYVTYTWIAPQTESRETPWDNLDSKPWTN